MTIVYHQTGTVFRDSFLYRTASGGVTGKTSGDFTIELSDDGVGNQATTGISITEVDATNNAGEYEVECNASTSFVSANGVYVLTIYDTASPEYTWSTTIVATDQAVDAPSPTSVTFTASASDGRVTDGGSPISGATILLKNPSGTLAYQLTTDADGLWGPVALSSGTWTFTATADGFQQGSGSVVVSGSTATGPGADVELSAITSSSTIVAGDLWEYTRRQSRDVVDATRANTVIKEIVNDALMTLAQSQDSEWFLTPYSLPINGSYTTGTVAATHDSTTLTLTDGTWPSWAASGEIYLDSTLYRVSSRDSDTQLTLASAFTGDTASGLSYTLFQDTYDLPADMLRFGELLNDHYLGESARTSYLEIMRAKASYPYSASYTTGFAFHGGDLIVYPPPSADATLTFAYYRKPAKLTSSAQTADWNPALETVLHRAIDYQICLKWGRTTAGLTMDLAQKALSDELDRAMRSNKSSMSSVRPLSGGTAGDSYASRIHRSRRF